MTKVATTTLTSQSPFGHDSSLRLEGTKIMLFDGEHLSFKIYGKKLALITKSYSPDQPINSSPDLCVGSSPSPGIE